MGHLGVETSQYRFEQTGALDGLGTALGLPSALYGQSGRSQDAGLAESRSAFRHGKA